MDIEGGGKVAILGMERVLAEARPIVPAELHGREEGEVVCNALCRHGYTLRHGPPEYLRIQDIRELDFDQVGTGVVATPPAWLPRDVRLLNRESGMAV